MLTSISQANTQIVRLRHKCRMLFEQSVDAPHWHCPYCITSNKAMTPKGRFQAFVQLVHGVQLELG